MTYRSELVASRKDSMGYILYVFKNLETNEYFICTRVPNWNHPQLTIGDVGYVEIKKVIAGETTYFASDKTIPYKYDNVYFLTFVKEINPVEKIKL